ncbi:hypothetical protein [Methylobacterium oxalidis]|uniref:Uncharacterized protein n=1 Tax=Methylobacterium oxalidis TaxID=944322 RepID=A0A512JCF3_9HYPH|nr:hypothetical protein [Methylobacterium oxalidis]GEP07611.1 hypothetical protein MOX02_56490 [Methylobacterium oxalidis]GJE33458.1 hypothetical protein LDDCCGHA_3658 [Methylobacterium oxalidis]GLS66195.1 hypothetical protein GCM10007888_45770 [Methylobacterium oxalidis]
MAHPTDPTFGPYPQQPQAVIPVTPGGVPLGGPFRKAVTINPGTPVQPGRSVLIAPFSGGRLFLKLADGGSIEIPNPGAQQRIDGFAVLDVNTTASTANSLPTVQVLS